MTQYNSIPELKGGLPYLGHALEFWHDPVRLLQRGRDRFGELFSVLLAGKQVYVLTGPKANKAFFRAPDDQLSQREVYRFTVPIFGKGVGYDVEPEIMDEQLGFGFPALRDERLQNYVSFMVEEAQSYTATWGEEGETDLLSMANELTLLIAMRCLGGHEIRRNFSTEFARLYRDLQGGFNLVAFFWPDAPLPAMRRRDRARNRLAELVLKIVSARMQGGQHGEDLLEALTNAHYSDGSPLSHDVIAGILVALIFAGHHNSAPLAAWTGILLAQHPEYISRIREEQATVIGDRRQIALGQVCKLLILERCIKEAERMYPPVVLMRTIKQDFEYGNFRMPAGGMVMVSPAVSHRIPEVFRNPDQYDPERFAPGREEDRKMDYALIGFGGGKHRCIGATFAYLQIKVIWTVLLRSFDMELIRSNPRPDYSTLTVGPERPCMIYYRRRPHT